MVGPLLSNGDGVVTSIKLNTELGVDDGRLPPNRLLPNADAPKEPPKFSWLRLPKSAPGNGVDDEAKPKPCAAGEIVNADGGAIVEDGKKAPPLPVEEMGNGDAVLLVTNCGRPVGR